MRSRFQTVGVVGLGTMGAGIAEVFARGGLNVIGLEIDPAALARGRGHLERSTGRARDRGKLTDEERNDILGRVRFTTDYADLAAADLVVEAVPEAPDLKRRVFAELDRRCRPETVLATNTSSLSVTALAAATSRPASVVGLHFFNPAPIMRLVEVIGTVVADPATVAAVTDLVRRLGKTPVGVGDRAGFVANALLLPYLNHAVRLYETGFATREHIDAAVQLGVGLPMGPLTLLDLIGADVALAVMDALWEEFRQPRHVAAPLLRRMVTAGLLGRKVGRGFYDHGEPGSAGQAAVPADEEPTAAVASAKITVVGEDAEDFATRVAKAGRHAVVAPFGEESAASADADLVVVANSSSRTVLDTAMRTGRPADVAGVRLVGARLAEVVVTAVTSPDTADAAAALCRLLGREVVRCPDRAGLLVDTLLLPHLNDAIHMLEAGYADAIAIDTAMTLGCGYPRGPLALADRLGLDTVYAGLRRMHQQYREVSYAPAPLLEQLVTARRLGERSGAGFHTYT